jgi:NADH-quinone oxidoreductase subunit M
LVALGTWEYNPWAALFTFSVVIFAAWYMMWMFQRVIFGRMPGELPDPGDTELTDEEKEQLAHAGAQGHGHEPLPVAGGSQEHESTDEAGDHLALEDGRADSSHWPDLTKKEAITLTPLAILTIAVGVYPKPLFDIVQPSFERILAPFLT